MMHSPILFADALPSWAETLTVVAFFVSIIGNLAQYSMSKTMREALKQKQQTELSPQPFIVAMEKEFTAKRDFELHVAENKKEHENLFSKIGGVDRGITQRFSEELKTLRVERKEDVGELHDKVNDVAKSVAGLEKETELQNQRMASMDAKLDRLIERR